MRSASFIQGLRLDHPIAVLAAGAVVIGISMGVRQTFGLFISPLSALYMWPITTVAFALAIQNLLWGITQPICGAIGDQWGAGRVVAFGGIAFSVGLCLAAYGGSPLIVTLGIGVCIGIGISAASFSVVFAVIGRTVSPEKRSMALGLASAGGSLGQMLMVPVADRLIASEGVTDALYGLAIIALALIPLAAFLAGRPPATSATRTETGASPWQAIQVAMRNRGYRLLTIGFFVCGFQLAFIAIHLPSYLALCQMPSSVGATALMLIGLFNVFGSWACGYIGARWHIPFALGAIYALRGLAIALFLLLPVTEWSVFVFSATMGLMWLGTVPLTSALIANVFGPRFMGTLYGVVFLSHQIGSFFGAWLGGLLFEMSGSYAVVWTLTAALGFVAAALHLPISTRPVAGAVAEAV